MRGCHDVDGAQVDVLDVVGAPVAHEKVHFLHRVGDVVPFDPVDHVDAFAGAARVHSDSANISAPAQEPCGV